MANIPVERTNSGTPWWIWLVGALLLALLAWFLIETFGDDDDVAVVDDTEAVVTPVVEGIDLSDVYVTRVVGDNTFFVSPTEGGTDETLVYLEEEATPGTATEGRYDVTPGQHLSITGSMESTPADLTPWGLTAEQATGVGDQYVRATSLTVLDDAMADGAMADGDMVAGAEDGLAALRGDLSDMVNRPIQLDGVRVTSVSGDSTFFVGTGNERTLVVLQSLGESQQGAGGTDGVFDVNNGDVVNIKGELKAFDAGMGGLSTLSDTDRAAVESRRYAIVVNNRGDLTKQ